MIPVPPRIGKTQGTLDNKSGSVKYSDLSMETLSGFRMKVWITLKKSDPTPKPHRMRPITKPFLFGYHLTPVERRRLSLCF